MSDNRNSKPPFIPIFIGGSTTALIIIGVIVFISIMSIFGEILKDEAEKDEMGGGFAMCQPKGEINRTVFDAKFEGAGAFDGKAQLFIDVAKKNNIDPVILSAIAFHETGNGTSNMVRERNNPGGLYNSATGSFFVFSSLEEGLDFMARNLYKNYYAQGLVTIEQIGNKYAPLGVANDPNNLNAHWIPNITKRVSEFGGLSMNCEVAGFASGLGSPVRGKITNTSRYGPRSFMTPNGLYSDFHTGIDFDCNTNDPLLSVLDGKVTLSQYHNLYGWYIKVAHGEQTTLYAHMNAKGLPVGTTVKKGEQIGLCGNTGNSFGSHLHVEIFINGGTTRIDPEPYFKNQK